MSDMALSLTLTADASAISGALRQTKAEMEALGQGAKSAGASAQAAAGSLAAAGEAAQGAAQKTGTYRDAMGRLRDENGKFVRSGSEAAAAARSAAAGLAQTGAAAASAAGGVGSLRGALGEIVGSVRAANDRIGGLVSGVRSLGAVVVGGFALDQIKDFGLGVVQAAGAYETLQTRLESVAGSQRLANEEMARAARLADDLATSERGALDIRARLLPLEQAGAVSRRNSLMMTTGLIDASKALGASQEDLASVMYGLGQALSQEIVRAEEFNQVTEPLPGITLKLDRAIQSMTGNASANFRAMVNNGEITRELFATALVKALQDFEGAGAKSVDTIDGATIRLSNEWERLKRSLIETDGVVRALDAVSDAMAGITKAAQGEPPLSPLQREIAEVEQGLARVKEAREGGLLGLGEDSRVSGVILPSLGAMEGIGNKILSEEAELRRRASVLAQREADLAMRAADEAMLDARQASEEAQRERDSAARGRMAEFVQKGVPETHDAQFKALEADRRRYQDLWDRRQVGEADYNRAMERIAEERAKIQESLDRASAPRPKASTARDPAAEAEAELAHAQAMAKAAGIRDDAARRSAEIGLLAERAAQRSGYDPAKQKAEYERVRAAEAEQLRAEDRVRAADDARRTAAQNAATAERERRREGERALRDQEAALKRIADLDAEAAASAAAFGLARQAATEAATAATLEGLMEIEARAEEAKRRLAVKEAGDKAFESLDKGAAPDQREAARAQAEATELAKQQAEAEEAKLQTVAALLGLRQEEARGAQAAARAAETSRAAASAGSLAEIAALEARGEAAARLEETDRKAQEARLSLGAQATKTEREAAAAAVRGLAAQEEALRLAEAEFQRRREIVSLQERAAEAGERGALAERTAAGALAARSRAEIARIQAQGEAEGRAAETERAVKDAREKLGPEASDPERREAEAAVRAEAAAKEQERLGGLLIRQAEALADLRARGAQAEGRSAVSLRQAAAAAGARSTLELEAARKAAEAETRQLERAEKIKAAGESLGPEADPRRVTEAEGLAAAEWDRAEAARQAGEFIERRAAALRFEERTSQTLADLDAQRGAWLAASGPAEERARAAQVELTTQQRIREARAAGLNYDEGAIRAAAEREASAARELDLLQRRGAVLEELERRRKAAEEDAAAARQGPAAQAALTIRRAGEDAARPLGGDPAVAAAAEGAARAEVEARRAETLAGLARETEASLRLAEARRQGAAALTGEQLRQKGAEAAEAHGGDADVASAAMRAERTLLHAAALEDLQERLNDLQTPYQAALEAADRWREGALANLDPMAAGYAQFAAEVEQVTARMYEDALQHSTDWADGVKRALEELRKANEDWATTSEDVVKGFNAEGKSAFVDFVKTGKVEVGSLAEFIRQKLAEIAYQQALAPVVNKVSGFFANLIGNAFGLGGSSSVANAASGSVKGFDRGGFTGEGGKYEPAGIVHRGEYVFDKETTARLFPLLEALHRSKGRLPGYASGGFVAPPAAQIEALRRAAEGEASSSDSSRSARLRDERPSLIFNIQTPDVEGFRRSQGQIAARMSALAGRAGRWS